MASQDRRAWATILFRVYAAIILAIGLMLLAGGLKLVLLGGSSYYLLCGLVVAASGVLLWRGRGAGALLYGAMLLGTLIWAVYEVGGDTWALVARLFAPAVLGAILLLPGVRRRLSWRRGAPSVLKLGGALALALVVALAVRLAAAPADPADPLYRAGVGRWAGVLLRAPPADKDWRAFGRDAGGSRFIALDQITPANVAKLEIAWQFRTGDMSGNFAATPLHIGNSLYVCTRSNDVIALDPETGRQRWRFKSGLSPKSVPHAVCRGLAYYEVPEAPGFCGRRIYTNTIGAELIALDAITGRPCPTFGREGRVNLLEGMGKVVTGYYYTTAAPTLVRGKIVLAGWVADNQHVNEPSGVVRAFDAVTGKLAWAFDVGRPDRRGLPPPGESYTPGTPNAWAPMSADETLGIVYVSTGNPTPDYFGAQRRPFEDRFSSSVIAIDAETGARRWSFQTVHHDLWDYDLPSQPSLIDIPGPGGTVVHALIQPTKTGDIFVLDRRTGRPITRVAERPVAQRGKAPDERLSPTQPASVGMPSFGGADLTERSMWGLTPLDQLWCRIKFREARYDGFATPPGLTPAIYWPGYQGGMDWGSAAIDPTRQIMIVNVNRIGNFGSLIPRAQADKMNLVPFGEGEAGSAKMLDYVPGAGTPYAAQISAFLSPLQVPCTQPPYGVIGAVDLRTKKLLWAKPFGTARDSGPLGMASMLPLPIGVPNTGGSVVTSSGIFFIGATQDQYIRAFETATGKLLWKARLPAGGHATPMSYISQASGRQFVVIAAGGHPVLRTRPGDYLMAYALPRENAR